MAKDQDHNRLKAEDVDANEEAVARELARVQQSVTGLSDVDQNPPAFDNETASPLDRKLASARKVMELLARMRPEQGSTDVPGSGRLDPAFDPQETIPSDDTRPILSASELELKTTHRDAPPNESREQPLPQSLGRFQIIRLLGQGGFGMVFLANDPQLSRRVALKVPSFHSLLNEEARIRFRREGRALAALNHPNIVPVYEVDQDSSITYIASAFVQGTDMSKWVRKHGPLSPRLAAQTVRVIADAIQHAHDRNVIHRDLKPANILLQSNESSGTIDPHSIQVADFGLARLLSESDDEMTRTGSLIGTPAFSAPEQLQPRPEQPPGKNADVYSLGAILYFLLTGQSPFQADSLTEMVNQVATQPPSAPEKHDNAIPRDLSAICLKCLAKQPRHRYESARDLQADLGRFLDGQVTVARPASQLTHAVRWIKRNPIPAVLMAVIATSTLVVSLVLVRSENLRALSEVRLQKTIQTSQQLQQAVDKLFLTVADTPELKLESFEKFRQQLLAEARVLMSQFVAEEPDDMELFLLFTDTQLSFIKLSDALGDNNLSQETSAELIADIHQALESPKMEDSMRNDLLINLADAELIQWKYDKSERRDTRQEELLDRINIDLASFENDKTNIIRASALSRVAAQSVFTRNYTTANEIQTQAMSLWDRVPDEVLAMPENLEQFALCYSNSVRVAAGAEDNRAARPIAERAIEVLEPHLENRLSPDTRYHIANIYRVYGYVIHGTDLAEGIRLSEVAHRIGQGLVVDHPAIPTYRAFICDANYSRALMLLKAKDNTSAETLLLENVELAQTLMQKFPGKTLSIRSTLANSLTVLGLIYRGRRQWQQQMETLLQTLELVRENIKSTNSDFHRIHECSLESEIGMCHIRLGDMESGVPLLEESVRKLEAFCASDPENGQAIRYRDLAIDETAEALRRAGKPEQASKYFDRLRELIPGEIPPQFMTDHIDQMVGVGDFDRANTLIDKYSPILIRQPAAIAHAEVLAAAITSLDQTGTDSPGAVQMRKRLVSLACQLLGQHLDKSDDPDRSMQTIAERKALAILLGEEELVRLLKPSED